MRPSTPTRDPVAPAVLPDLRSRTHAIPASGRSARSRGPRLAPVPAPRAGDRPNGASQCEPHLPGDPASVGDRLGVARSSDTATSRRHRSERTKARPGVARPRPSLRRTGPWYRQPWAVVRTAPLSSSACLRQGRRAIGPHPHRRLGQRPPSLLRTRCAVPFPGPFYGRRPDAEAPSIRISSKRCRRLPVCIPTLDTSAARIRRRHNPTQAPCPNSKH